MSASGRELPVKIGSKVHVAVGLELTHSAEHPMHYCAPGKCASSRWVSMAQRGKKILEHIGGVAVREERDFYDGSKVRYFNARA